MLSSKSLRLPELPYSASSSFVSYTNLQTPQYFPVFSFPNKTHAQAPRLEVSSHRPLQEFSNIQNLQQHEDIEEGLRKKWRVIQGSNDWEGLLDPLDPHLRSELIRYGEFAQVCYDAFDYDAHSKYRGSCKYNKSRLFEQVGLPNTGYEVTKYLYATSKSDLNGYFAMPKESSDPWCKYSNWMGYVAVCNSKEEIKRLGRRDIVVAWRGTVTELEWLENIKDFLCPLGLKYPRVKVESGFLHLYTTKNSQSSYNKQSAREQLLLELQRLINMYKDEEISITVTGHSLGGALALLSAYDIAKSELTSRCKNVLGSPCKHHEDGDHLEPLFRPCNKRDEQKKIPLSVISFSAPRVGNKAFKKKCEDLQVKTLRIVNEKDIVPKLPGLLFNENFKMLRNFVDNLPWTYSHVGTELVLSSDMSEYLQPTLNPVCHHNLEAHLHLLDGYLGFGKGFCSSTDRDPALVNKSSDFLRRDLEIPPFWWQEQYKGLVRNGKGAQRPRDEAEFAPVRVL